MDNEKKVQVEMTAEQAEAFAAFQAKQKKETEAAQRKADRETYAKMVDEEVAAAIPELRRLSDNIKVVKSKVYQNFAQVLDIKSNVLGITKDTQRTHTFTHSDGNMRLTLGYNCIDGYRDTVEDGITMVKPSQDMLSMLTVTRDMILPTTVTGDASRRPPAGAIFMTV